MKALPEDVQEVFGRSILDAQYGDHPEGARPFGEVLPAGPGPGAHERQTQVTPDRDDERQTQPPRDPDFVSDTDCFLKF